MHHDAPAPSDRYRDQRTLWARLRLRPAVQVGALIALWWLAARLAGWLGFAQLGGVLGLFALWLLLINGWLPLAWVQHGAHWLIRHMLLFFVPAVLVVLDHRELLGWVGVKLFTVIVLGTVSVMACTALTIEWCLRLARHRAARKRLQRHMHKAL